MCLDKLRNLGAAALVYAADHEEENPFSQENGKAWGGWGGGNVGILYDYLDHVDPVLHMVQVVKDPTQLDRSTGYCPAYEYLPDVLSYTSGNPKAHQPTKSVKYKNLQYPTAELHTSEWYVTSYRVNDWLIDKKTYMGGEYSVNRPRFYEFQSPHSLALMVEGYTGSIGQSRYLYFNPNHEDKCSVLFGDGHVAQQEYSPEWFGVDGIGRPLNGNTQAKLVPTNPVLRFEYYFWGQWAFEPHPDDVPK